MIQDTNSPDSQSPSDRKIASFAQAELANVTRCVTCKVCSNMTEGKPKYWPSTSNHGTWAIDCIYCGTRIPIQL